MQLKKLATSFSRGLSQAASHTLNDSECQTAENFVFKDRAATVRKGFTIHAQVTSAPIIALEKFYQSDGDSFFTAIGEGKLFYSITSGSFTSLSIETISGAVSKAVYDGAIYFTDLSTPVKYFNGEVVGVAGLSSPVFKKQLDDCEDASRWVAQDTNGGISIDTNYMHRDKGKKAIAVFASNPATAHVSQYGGANNSIDTLIEDFANSPARNSQKAMCMDTSGNIHVIANQGSGSTSSLYHYYSQNYGSTWTTVQACSGKAYQIGGQIHPNYSGGISLIYNTSTYFKHANWTYQSGWRDVDSSGVKITSFYTPVFSTAIDRSGNIHSIIKAVNGLTTATSGAKYYTKYNIASSLWSSVSAICTSGGGTVPNAASVPDSKHVDICVDRSNVTHIVWSDLLWWGFGANTIAYVNGLSGIIDTSSLYFKSGGGTNNVPYHASICVDNSSTLHCVYSKSVYGGYPVYYNNKAKYNGSSEWSSEYIVHTSSDGSQQVGGGSINQL